MRSEQDDVLRQDVFWLCFNAYTVCRILLLILHSFECTHKRYVRTSILFYSDGLPCITTVPVVRIHSVSFGKDLCALHSTQHFVVRVLYARCTNLSRNQKCTDMNSNVVVLSKTKHVCATDLQMSTIETETLDKHPHRTICRGSVDCGPVRAILPEPYVVVEWTAGRSSRMFAWPPWFLELSGREPTQRQPTLNKWRHRPRACPLSYSARKTLEIVI